MVRIYYDEIFVYAYRQISDRETAMDLTQEIFIAALRAIHGFDEKKASFRTWLYKIALNKTTDYLRSRGRSPVQCSIDELELAQEGSFEQLVEDSEFSYRLERYISTLNEENRRIFQLKFFDERTFAQIAYQLDLPESTVKTKYYRLIKKIKTEFLPKEDLK